MRCLRSHWPDRKLIPDAIRFGCPSITKLLDRRVLPADTLDRCMVSLGVYVALHGRYTGARAAALGRAANSQKPLLGFASRSAGTALRLRSTLRCGSGGRDAGLGGGPAAYAGHPWKLLRQFLRRRRTAAKAARLAIARASVGGSGTLLGALRKNQPPIRNDAVSNCGLRGS